MAVWLREKRCMTRSGEFPPLGAAPLASAQLGNVRTAEKKKHKKKTFHPAFHRETRILPLACGSPGVGQLVSLRFVCDQPSRHLPAILSHVSELVLPYKDCGLLLREVEPGSPQIPSGPGSVALGSCWIKMWLKSAPCSARSCCHRTRCRFCTWSMPCV